MIRACSRRRLRPFLFALLAVNAAPLTAQQPSGQPRLQVAVGGTFVGVMPLRSGSADLVRPDGGQLPLFSTDVSLRPGPGVEVHLARQLGSRWAAELTGGWTATRIRTRISNDFEDVPASTLTERLSRFAVEASLVWSVSATADRSVFLRAGGGWMREVAGATGFADDGVIGNVGVGMKYWWSRSTPGRGRRWGVRLDGRAVLRARGIDLGADTVRVAPAAAADVLFGF
jgi:hypothetical protein